MDLETDSQPFSHTTDKYEFRANPKFFEEEKKSLSINIHHEKNEEEEKEKHLSIEDIELGNKEEIEDELFKDKIKRKESLFEGDIPMERMDDQDHRLLVEKKTMKKVERELNPILFARGVPTDEFYLILSGKVCVVSGNEGFLVEMTTFNYLGD